MSVSQPCSAPSADFSIHGIGVRVHCPDPALAERIRGFLAPYLADLGAAAPAIEAEIQPGSVLYPVPLHARRVLRYSYFRSYFLDGRTYFTDYYSTIAVEPGGARMSGNLDPETVSENGLNFFLNTLFTLSLFEALRFFGLYYLHAAGLESPDGQGFLISGNSGSGKTTLTLSLIRAGFRFLSDDTVFMRLLPGMDVEILGFAREFHVPEDLVSQGEWREMARLPDYSSHFPKKMLKPDDFFPEQRLPRIVNPMVLIFPRIGNDAERLERLSLTESLNELLPQSLSVMFNPANASPHLEAIKRVLKHGRGFRLYSSPEMKGNSERVARVINAAGEQAREPRK